MAACDARREHENRVAEWILLGVLCVVALAATLLASPGRAFGGEAVAPSDERSLAIATVSVDGSAAEEGAVAMVDNGMVVYVSRTGSKYHFSSVCSGMNAPLSMSLGDAISRGYEPCGTCASNSPGSDDPAPVPMPSPEPSPGPPIVDVASTTLSRLAGPIALDTMKAITTKGFANGSCQTVVVATLGGYWDALTASALAGLTQAPVLLTDHDTLSPQTASEITRLGAKEVLVVGGMAAISNDVVGQIEALGAAKVKRYAGAVATQTAVEIFKASKDWGDLAIVATSKSYHDALSIAPYAYAKNAPIFLVEADDGMLSNESLSALMSGGFKQVCIVGGEAAVSGSVESQLGSLPTDRLWGATAYETSERIATWCVTQGMMADGMGIATGEDYYDALAGAALCGKNNAVIALVSDTNHVCIDGFISAHASRINAAYAFGGSAALSPAAFNAIASELS